MEKYSIEQKRIDADLDVINLLSKFEDSIEDEFMYIRASKISETEYEGELKLQRGKDIVTPIVLVIENLLSKDHDFRMAFMQAFGMYALKYRKVWEDFQDLVKELIESVDEDLGR